MDFALTESQELIRKEVGALARTFSLDYWLDKDDRAEYPSDFVKAFADNGWLGIMVPEAYGGAGLGVTEAALMLHEICASGAGTTGASRTRNGPSGCGRATAGWRWRWTRPT